MPLQALNADPYDIEAQKKIEEAIRMEAVLENMQHAMEYSVSAVRMPRRLAVADSSLA